MREDINSIVSTMMNTNNVVDLDRVLTKAVCFDAAVMRAFLLDSAEDESDMEEFFNDMSLDDSFMRGFMVGLVQSLLIERSNGEVMGRHSHSEIVEMFDAAAAHSIESSL